MTGSVDDFVPLSITRTAELASKLSMQTWSSMSMNSSSKEEQSIADLTQNVLAILLIRIIALISTRNQSPNLPAFNDLSTSTICYAILNHTPSKENGAETAVNGEHESIDEKTEQNGIDGHNLQWPESITNTIISQLREYIHKILSRYRAVCYHNYEHAYHVFISAQKLLDMALCEYDYSKSVSNQPVEKPTRVTYGLKSDPLFQLAYLFSALVHDVDHTGVSNRQLVLECDELAIMYNDQSVAEQRSLAIAFSLLMNKDYQALRSIMFQHDDYQRFRKCVIDLVLCTDIASPERVQLVKSKWKEAFGEKQHTLAPAPPIKAREKMSVSDQIDGDNHKVGHRNSLEFDEAPMRRNAGIQGIQSFEDTSLSGQKVDAPVHRVSGVAKVEEESKRKLRRGTLSFNSLKRRNAWKSKPADPSMVNVGKNHLLRSFFKNRSSQRADIAIENITEPVQNKKSFAKRLRVFKRKKRNKAIPENNGPNLDQKRNEVVTPLRSSAISGSFDDDMNFNGLLDQYDNLSESSGLSSNATSVYATNQSEKRYYRSARSSMNHGPGSNFAPNAKQTTKPDMRSSGKGSIGSDSVKSKSLRNSLQKIRRRFTDPPNQIFQGKKFHFRLGIRRALDLTGDQIDAYGTTNEAKFQNDPDRPDELKEIVILEQLMKAADVAANMQNWETMVTWCKRLFQEQKKCFVDGRGVDPIKDWHENQIAFFESYTMPLACRLAETGIFEYASAQEFVNGVRQNNIRWMIEGMQVIEEMVFEWENFQVACQVDLSS